MSSESHAGSNLHIKKILGVHYGKNEITRSWSE